MRIGKTLAKSGVNFVAAAARREFKGCRAVPRVASREEKRRDRAKKFGNEKDERARDFFVSGIIDTRRKEVFVAFRDVRLSRPAQEYVREFSAAETALAHASSLSLCLSPSDFSEFMYFPSVRMVIPVSFRDRVPRKIELA